MRAERRPRAPPPGRGGASPGCRKTRTATSRGPARGVLSRIFWDTNLFISLMEGSGHRADTVTRLRQRMLGRGDQLDTSTLALGEVLVKPLGAGDETLRQQDEQALRARAVLVPFDRAAAGPCALIRRDRTIRPPDALQLACAAPARVAPFVTSDDRLNDKVVPGVQVATSLARVFLRSTTRQRRGRRRAPGT